MNFNEQPLLKRLKWINTIFLIVTPIAAIVLSTLDVALHGWDWRLLTFCFLFLIASSLGITGGYHRLFSHRSYDTKPFVKLFYLLFGAASVQGSALKWCSDHRRHHRAVDTEEDPYNIKKGFFFAHMGWVFLKEDPRYEGVFAADLAADPLVAWQHRNIDWLTPVMAFGFPTLVGWMLGSPLGGLAFGGFVRVVLIHHCTFFINSLCHMVGTQPYSDRVSARDSFVMSLLAYGEGYHNFHHQFASDYRNGIRWYHWDPTKWVVSLMSHVGWTYKLRVTPQATILRAQMMMDEKHLLARGVSSERLDLVKQKIENAQVQWRALKEEYAKAKENMQTRSRQHALHLKAEIKVARLEFKLACRQWVAYKKVLIALPLTPSA